MKLEVDMSLKELKCNGGITQVFANSGQGCVKGNAEFGSGYSQECAKLGSK